MPDQIVEIRVEHRLATADRDPAVRGLDEGGAAAVVVVGTWWRYRYDKFGWTTRSSQLYESAILRWGTEDQKAGMRSFLENGPGQATFTGR